jgi:RNA polymerase sigma-70 factor (ECF subfamily)
LADAPDELLRLAPEAFRLAALASPEAARLLADAVARARAAHPTIALGPDAFVAHLARHVPADELTAALPGLHAADLYLCRAALDGDAAALRAFEPLFLRTAEALLARAGVAPADREDLTQQVRMKMLVAEAGREPKLALYAGRGPLPRWLRAGVLRSLLDARQRKRPEELFDEDDWLTWPSLADDPELASLKLTCRDAFKRAASEALAALAPRARLLMRQHLLDGVGVARLATMYGVHAATVYRWLDDARGELVRETRQRLAASLRVDAVEIDRLLGLLESQLDVSVRRLLETG